MATDTVQAEDFGNSHLFRAEGMTLLTQSASQLTEQVLLRMHPIDRLNGALTSRTWAELVSTSRLLEDVRLFIRHGTMNAVIPTLKKTQRKYGYLKITNGEGISNGGLGEVGSHLPVPWAEKSLLFPVEELRFDSEFWAEVGKDLLDLELIWDLPDNPLLYFIIQFCPKMESVRVAGASEFVRTYV